MSLTTPKPKRSDFNSSKAYRAAYERWRSKLPHRIAANKKQARSLAGLYSHLKAIAKYKKTVCTITFDEYVALRQLPCFYDCGRPLSEAGHSLDRRNPKGPYSVDNVVPCCKLCNTIKGDWWTVEEMYAASQAVASLRAKKAK